ncbi:hypothetical protein ACFVW5_06190 [Streptomyces sp. NPDC058232]|uniref:hypothetical protein n=1 Tax=Streptomyces sp. NPDC058232 TaxID=3346393 RepID=UPI0036E2CD16
MRQEHGEVAFDYGLYWFKGQSMGTGQANVKAYNRQLCARIEQGKAKPSWIVSRALAGVFATAAFGLINNSTWKISSGMDVGRLIGASVVSLLALTAWIIIDHELWERPHGSLSRSFSRLYNTVTCVTITFGVLSLYVILFFTLFGVSNLILTPSAFGTVNGQDATVHDYAVLAWFVSSMGMVGGAFGSGLEDDGTVRNAAYGERQRHRWQKLREEKKVREELESES